MNKLSRRAMNIRNKQVELLKKRMIDSIINISDLSIEQDPLICSYKKSQKDMRVCNNYEAIYKVTSLIEGSISKSIVERRMNVWLTTINQTLGKYYYVGLCFLDRESSKLTINLSDLTKIEYSKLTVCRND